ncbi:MAG: hypothetical protein OXC31_26530, partial [Spirochaetaceae bacterium]|nr:hypothetical protein [Spirochaetaceae bacterium]
MDRVNYVRGQVAPSADMNTAQENAETAIDRLAQAVLGGEILEGLVLDEDAGFDGSVSAGSGYDALGRRVSLAAAAGASLTSVPRPPTGQVRWAAVVLRYGRTGSGDVDERSTG